MRGTIRHCRKSQGDIGTTPSVITLTSWLSSPRSSIGRVAENLSTG